MKKTRQHMEEARKVYDLYWDSYQAGDIDTFAAMLDENFEMIGTSESEICHSKKEGIEFFKGQVDELIGKVKMRNRQINEISLNGLVLINELCDIYTLSDSESEWTFYSKIRISTLLHETPSGWKVVQQHGSLPDMRVLEGETLAIEKITKENLELRDAVKRRTAELENKNRELEIEASLERVRARSMAMQKSEELAEVVRQINEEIKTLGIDINNTQIGTDFTSDPRDGLNDWVSVEGQRYLEKFHIPFIDHPITAKFYETLNNDLGTFTAKYSKSEKNAYFKLLFENSDFKDTPEERKNFILNAPGWVICGVILKTSSMQFARYTLKEFTREEVEIFKRFGNVFGQAYTRFLDLQKAEEQAREAQIEASLERVRAKAMAMHSSKDIESATAVVFNELSRLGIDLERCGITLMNETPVAELWSTTLSHDNKEVIDIVTGYLDFRIHPLTQKSYRDWKEKKKFSTYYLVGEELQKYYDKLEKQPEYKFPKVDSYPDQQVLHSFFFNAGAIFVYTTTELSTESKKIVQRFTNVFEQTYTRFLDLQKAEEQAREAEIQLALERVRARTMAMHNSVEFGEVASVLFEQISSLTSAPDRFNIAIANESDESFDIFITDQDGVEIENRFKADIKDSPVLEEAFENWKNDAPHLIQDIHGKALENWIRYMGDIVGIPFNMEQVKEHRFLSSVFFSHGFIGITTHEEPDSEIIHLLERFSKVFQQTYVRFLDLQKAEEQAREAKIETALEKVRSRTMGMQSSEELPEVANIMFLEVQALGIPAWSCGYCILLDDGKSSTCIMSSEGTLQKPFMLPHSGEASFIEWDDFVQSEETFFTQELGGKAIESHYNFMKSLPQLTSIFRELEEAGLSLPTYQINHLCKISHGFLLFITYEQVPDAHDIFKRFTNVFEQTYTRFLDLKKAEKLALETARQSSLDRIRAEIGSMRSAEDLQQITPIIWDELKTLDIPFIRCGVFIIDYENGISHTYLSTSQGEPIAALHLPIEGISLIENAVTSWKKKKIYSEHWDKQDFREWTQKLIEGGFIESKKKYEAGLAPETLNLHFLPFKHGMLYIGNTEPLSQEKLDLGQSMAKAFSVAYDRYEDFNKLEQAKQKIEEAFEELEAAKDQLVQQEKLASLGQLTAGIAHEIKNPLNFVNNFSDLSIELVEEAREELSALSNQLSEGTKKSPFEGGAEVPNGTEVGDDTGKNHEFILDILDILDDIENNLRIIHQHGNRADGIVKSMLQHSRGGSGKMEPTDVNTLIKEYTNLAFHGMRAGKDPIDVDVELDLDEKVGEVSLVAEDFSRVILNLCNNAFDAMREKPEQNYEPKLTIKTFRKDSNITIEIKDNGPGIPDEIKDKIMQPFFTTKKGTAGTGLGLSITNDIIKAHGGELAIQTSSKGSAFIIHLKVDHQF